MDQARLKELLSYNPESGVFTWIQDRGKCQKGDVASGTNCNGYRSIRLDYVRYPMHRLAWLYVHGKFPENFIDHINMDKSDNRLCNLRPVTNSQNMMNSVRKGQVTTSRWKGVSWISGKKKWKATVNANGVKHWLGYFNDEREAAEECMFALLKHHGEFARLDPKW